MYNTIIQTEFITPSYVYGNGLVTGNEWTYPDNILVVDGNVASSNPGAGVASDITVGYTGFALPQNAIVTGVQMQIIGYGGAQTSPVLTLTPYLFNNENNIETFYPYVTPFTGFTPTLATYTLGTSTYLFSTTLTADQVNNIKFNLQANGDMSLDSFLVSVFYYIPAPVTPPTPEPGVCVDCSSPIQVQAMYLELPFLVGETKFYLKKGSFAYPNGIPVQPGDVGTCGGKIYFTFDEGKSKTQGGNWEENALVDTTTGTWTVLPSGVIEVDIFAVTNRGLDFKTPATHVATNMSDHDANSKVIITNNEPYNLTLIRSCQVDTVFSAPIEVDYNGVAVDTSLHKINFTGAGQTTTQTATHEVEVNIPGFNTAPPQVANTISYYSDTQVTSFSTDDFTVTGTDRYLAVSLTVEMGVALTSALFNGASVSTITSSTIGGFTVYALELVAPDLGVHTLDLTFGTPTMLAGNIVLYNGVDQSTPSSTNTASGGASSLVTISPTTTTTNSIVFHAFGTQSFPILYTAGTGESIVSQTVAGQLQNGVENQSVGTPATVTSQVNLSVITDWADIAFGINGIGPSAAGVFSINSDTTSAQQITAGSGIIVNDLGGGVHEISATGGGGGSTPFSINQTGHGFSVGDIITPDINQWKQSLADAPANAEAWAQVTVVTDADNFTALPLVGNRQQDAAIVALIAGFTGGDPLYVDAVTEGAFTNVAPTGGTTVTKPIGYVEADAGGIPISLCTVNYRGQNNQVIPAGISENGSGSHTGGAGVITIAHGLGTTPSSVEIFASAFRSGPYIALYSNGTYNGTTNSCAGTGYNSGGGIPVNINSNTKIIYLQNDSIGNDAQFACTVDATNITLTPSVDVVTFVYNWKAQA